MVAARPRCCATARSSWSVYDGAGELYDPDSGTWTATGKMTTPRHATRPRCCPMARCSWRAATSSPATSRWTRPSCTTPTRGRGPRSRTCTPSASHRGVRCCPMARCSWSGPAGANRRPSSCTTRPPGHGPPPGAWLRHASISQPRVGGWHGARGRVGLDDSGVLASPSCTTRAPGPGPPPRPMLRSRTPGELASRSLLDGTVLVAGGSDCNDDGVCVPTGAAELYVPAGVSPPALPAFPSPPPPVFPSPTPSPTPFPPAAGPVPPNARSWKVTVDNKSSEPATLFVAEEDESGCYGSSGPRPRTWSQPAPP